MITRKNLYAIVMLIACAISPAAAQPPCPADNAFFTNLTPTVGAGNSTANTCVLTGEYITTNVCAGATYTWSTCASGIDITSTLRNNVGLAVLASDDDGCGTFAGPTQITWTATFTGTVRFYVDQNPCLNSGICVPVVVTQNSECGTGAGAGPCNTSVGTFNIDVDGVPTSLGSTVYLCNDGSCINATSNGDYVLPGSVLFSPPTCLSAPELMWAFYTAPPTTGDPSTDPAWDGTYWSGSDFNECLNGAGSSLGNPQNSEWWIAPITADDGDNDAGCGGLQHDGDLDGCFVQGAPLHVVYLTAITNGTPDVNCYNGVVTVQVLGGMPAYDGSNYTINNTGAGSVVSGTVTDGEYVVINGLSNGDSWSFDVSDGAGCTQTISGTYTECPCPTVDYTGLPATMACDDPAVLIQADESGMAPGESISPCYYVQIMPTNGNANNTINYYENGTLIGTLTPGANTMYQGYISFISPSANNTVELCDVSAGTNMEYMVFDCHSGNLIASGTWIADGVGCEVITVTPPSTNMDGTSTWSATPVPGSIVATSDAGAAIFDPSVAGAGTHDVTYSWDDGNGCSGTSTQQVTITDVTPPTITCPSNITANNDAGNCDASVITPNPTIADNCVISSVTWNMTGATTGSSPGTGINFVGTATFNEGTTTITYTITDSGGNTATCSFTVTVNDNEAPVANCANFTVSLDAAGNATIVGTDVDGGSTDNCGIVSYSVTPSAFTCADIGANTVTLTVEDAAGNTDNCTATVTVEDNIAPVANCANFTVSLDAAGNATIVGTDVDGGSTDNCGIVSYSVTPSAFTCADIGANTVTLTVEDAAGNTDNCTATVTVQDNLAPTANCANFTVSLDAAGNATIVGTDVDGGSTDNCGIVSYSVTPNTFTCADVGANTVTLTVEDAAGNTDNCTATVTVNDPNIPTASAGSDDAICDGDTYTLNGASGGSATTGSWSTPGDGTFAPGVTDPNATYTPGATDISNGSVTLTWTTDPSPCSTDSESMILTINSNPTPTITGNTEYCAGSTAAISTGAFSSYSWSNGAGTQNTTVTIADNPITVTVTDGNGCVGTSAQYNVTENPNPQISLTPTDPTVCNGTDGYITVNSVSGSTSGDLSWTGTATGTDNGIGLPHDITGLGAGNYNVTFTDVNGCVSSVESTVLNNPGAPAIDAILDTSSCGVDYVVPDPTTYITGTNLSGNQAFYSAPGGNAGDEIAQGTVITSGMSPMTIYVYDNSGSCSSEISFVVEVNENPTTTISPDPAETCEGTSINLDGNPAGGSGTYSSHVWTGDVSILSGTNIQAPSTLTGATYGTYNLTYTVTDDNGCTGTDDITVVINEMPVLSGDQEICEDEVTTISSTGTPDASTPWTSSDPSVATVDANGDVTGVSGGTVDITFLDDNGCSEMITVTVNPNPTINLTPYDPSTCNGTDGYITVSGAGTGTVDWSGTASGTVGSTTLPYDITNLAAGNYDVTFTDGVTGCESDVVSTSLNNPGAPVIDPISDTSSCEVDFAIPDPSTYITGTNLTGNESFYSAPGGNAGDELIQGTLVTNGMSPMTIYVYDNNGVCESEITFTVYVNENPTVSISPNPITACTDENIQVNGNPSGGSGNYVMHDWTNTGAVDLDDPSISNPIYNSSTVGNYDLTYTVEDDNGCTGSETIAVTVVERTVLDPIPAIVSCGTLDLDSLPTITGTNLSGNEDFYDDTQANGGQVVTGDITSSGTYYIYDTGGNCSNEETVDITINEVPEITSLLEDTAYCDYEIPGDIEFTVTGQADWTIEYTLDGVNQTVTSSQNTINLGNAPGIYNITLIEDDVCSDTIDVEFELLLKPTPPAPTVYEDTEYCISDELDSMRAEGTGGTFSWYLNDLGQFLGFGNRSMPQDILGSSTYLITETVNGCESEPSEININIIECEFILSTAITPDNDGLNDTWAIPDLDVIYPNNVVQVYNRWGSLIFEHDSSKEGPYNDNPWDGTVNGSALPVGSYYFVIDHNDGSGETTNGAVSIILE